MSRYLFVDFCSECYHLKKLETEDLVRYFCKYPGRDKEIKEPYRIPVSCPLPKII
jgi:hypothetical protein